MTEVVIELGVGNIKSLPLMTEPKVESDIILLRGMVHGKNAIVGGAEIKPDYYKRLWTKHFHGFTTFGLATECPLSVGPGFDIEGHHFKRLTRGIKRLSPDRFETTFKGTVDDAFHVAAIVTHNVSASKNPHADRLKERKHLFSVWRFKMRRHIKKLHDQGYTVFILGDLNAPNPVNLHPDQQVLVCRDLMQIIVVPAPGIEVVRVGNIRYEDGNTDHIIPALTVRMRRRMVRPVLA